MTSSDPVPTSGFRIRGLMALIAIAACVLAIPPLVSVGLLLSSPLIAPHVGRRMFVRGQRTPAAYCFGTFAGALNVFYVTSCFTPIYAFIVGLCVGWALLAILPTVSLGSAWARLSSAVDAKPRRSPVLAWSIVVLLTLMPLVTLCSLWPIRLLYLAARPEMERLANTAIAGEPFSGPRSVGLFEFAGSRFDPATGDVALLIEPDPAHPRGFLWKRSGARASRADAECMALI